MSTTTQAPKGKGASAKEWLEEQGLVATTPAIRSSDFESILSCPFQYYLSRRLNLVKALRWSAALSRGSWFHSRLELYQESTAFALSQMRTWLEQRQKELKEICAGRGIHGEEQIEILDREEKDMYMAFSWFEAMQAFQVPGKGSVVDYLNKPYWRLLGTEVVAEVNHSEYGRMIGQFDMLFYHEKQNSLYIVDAKTTAGSTIDRLQTCPIEFQTQHYVHMLKWLHDAEKITQRYSIPRDAKIGGMIHIAVQKPTIEFGMKDRDHEEHEHLLTRGPRKGQIEIRKTYSGEPKWENYRNRCRDWFLGNGDYILKKAERNSDPPINFSLTYGSSLLDKHSSLEYHQRLQLIRHYASIDPAPGSFPMSAKHLHQFGKMSPFTPFYLTEPRDWPGILATEGFMIESRDDVKVDLSC